MGPEASEIQPVASTRTTVHDSNQYRLLCHSLYVTLEPSTTPFSRATFSWQALDEDRDSRAI